MAERFKQPTVSDADEQGNEVPNPTPAATVPDDAEAKPQSITIVFKDNNNAEVSFKLKRTTKLKKAMDAYAQRASRERRTLRFLFDGQRVLDENSAEDLGMEDMDSVEVHTEQVGGGWELKE